MLEHARHFGTVPNILPLDPENFQNARSQRAARFSDLFSKILLTRRSQFLHKMWVLSELVDDLSASFEEKVKELCDEDPLYPERVRLTTAWPSRRVSPRTSRRRR
jgi:hypothetical protein